VPQNINNLLKDITIDQSLSKWIHEVITTKIETKCITATSSDRDGGANSHPVKSVSHSRADITGMFLRHLKEFIAQYNTLLLPNTSIESKDVEEIQRLQTWIDDMCLEMAHGHGDTITRVDLIDYCFRNYMSMMWLIRSNQNVRSIPKDIFSDKDPFKALPQHFIKMSRDLTSGLRPVYMVMTDQRFHEMILKDLMDSSDYVSNMCTKYSRNIEINKQVMFKDSFQTVDTNEFVSLLEKYL
jgi:hypothetical protein